ncbi:hypothetical protein ILYODFUR_036146, partial [Ilyodon furcidens]
EVSKKKKDIRNVPGGHLCGAMDHLKRHCPHGEGYFNNPRGRNEEEWPHFRIWFQIPMILVTHKEEALKFTLQMCKRRNSVGFYFFFSIRIIKSVNGTHFNN